MLPKNVYGMILFFFIGFYLIGIYIAHREKIVAKRLLPIIFKRILFLGTSNKYTLNTIIYQTSLILVTIATLTIFYFNLIISRYAVYTTYLRCILILLIMEAICMVKVNNIENKRNNKK